MADGTGPGAHDEPLRAYLAELLPADQWEAARRVALDESRYWRDVDLDDVLSNAHRVVSASRRVTDADHRQATDVALDVLAERESARARPAAVRTPVADAERPEAERRPRTAGGPQPPDDEDVLFPDAPARIPEPSAAVSEAWSLPTVLPDAPRSPWWKRRAGPRQVLAYGLIMVGLVVFGYAAANLLSLERPVPGPEIAAEPGGTGETAEPGASRVAAMRELDDHVPTRRVLVDVAAPTHITIDAIDVDHPVVPVGVRDDGAMEVPDDVDEIGWYEPGIRPGEYGSALLAGHVDSRTQGPGAFYDLRRLEEGDRVVITDADGTERSWIVTRLVRYPKTEIPMADLIRWEGDETELVLVTCGGEFDRTARSYEDNIVVYTTPTGG